MIYKKLLKNETSISIIGLGYVGLPLAVSFSKKFNVTGFDVDSEKIELYKKGIDPTREVGNDRLRESDIKFVSNPKELNKSLFHIVTVPTPINGDKTPDLTPIKKASEILGRNLVKGAIVVYESTVYPGVTEDICIPILERESNMKCGVDFKVGYSPERINPGDKVNTLEKIKKVVSGIDEYSLNEIDSIYSEIITAGTYRASSIKVAEASKVIENSQRDINIAFMNELSMVFNLMEIDTYEVLEAAATKWNFLKFYPGLVGGHCIGVDPYYFTYKAEELGYHSQIILSGRSINNEMPKFVVENTIKEMIRRKINIGTAKVGLFGVTFKENCPDIRNSKNFEIVEILKSYGIDVSIFDTEVDKEEVNKTHNVQVLDLDSTAKLDVLIVAVPHKNSIDLINSYLIKNPDTILLDLKQVFKEKSKELNLNYWSL